MRPILFIFIPKSSSLVTTFRFAQNRGEGPSAETESLLKRAYYADFGAIAWHAIILAVNPHASCAVVHFENSRAQRAERISDVSGDCHLFANIAARIAVDLPDIGSLRAPRQQECTDREQQNRKNSEALSEH